MGDRNEQRTTTSATSGDLKARLNFLRPARSGRVTCSPHPAWGSFPMWWLPPCPGDLYPKLITWEPQSNSSRCVVGFSPCRCTTGNVFSLNHENFLRNALEVTINSNIQWELSDLLGFSFLWNSKLYTCWNKSGVCLQILWPIYGTAWNLWPAGHRGLPGPQTLRSALACLTWNCLTNKIFFPDFLTSI